MKTEKFDFKVATAYGTTLPSPVAVSGEFEAYENYDELKAANAIPDNDEILNFVNARRKAAARSSATNDALQKAGIEKPTAANNDVAIREMAKVFKARGDSEEVATQKAKAALGL